jgi:hypothetical protein
MNVYDRDWDVLILLDTCRVDALKQVESEYDFLSDIGSIYSIGSTSSEWIAQTFSHKYIDEIQKTAYVSGNGWAEEIIENRVLPEEHGNSKVSFSNWDIAEQSDFLSLDQAWRYESEPRFDHGLGHPRPRYVTDRAISVAREHNPSRLIIHYSQPHSPYTSQAIREDRELEEYEKNPFDYLKEGGNLELVWNAYIDHLKYVLDDVKMLLNNLDAEKVVISADHGEAFGEWGIYGHGSVLLHPQVKVVPWTITSASNVGEYEPSLQVEQSSNKKVSDQLEALGYK